MPIGACFFQISLSPVCVPSLSLTPIPAKKLMGTVLLSSPYLKEEEKHIELLLFGKQMSGNILGILLHDLGAGDGGIEVW